MEFRVLRYFLAVVREESISGAANFLHISQPTLSRQLKELEDKLGVQLFIRGNRRITLTDEGRLLRKRAEEIVTLVDKAESELNRADDILSGEIYIGGGETQAMRLLAKTARQFHRDYPQVRYHLFSGNADDVTERLEKGLLDFGVLIGAANLDKYGFLPIPAADTWGVLLRKDHPLAARHAIQPEDLLDLPLLCSRQSFVEKEFSAWLGEKADRLHIVATYNLIYNASLMVEEGLGCALCLDKLANTAENSPLCFRPLEPRLEAKLHLVWKKHQVFSKTAEKFLARVQEDLQEK